MGSDDQLSRSQDQAAKSQHHFSQLHDQAQRSPDLAEPERQGKDVLHNEVLYDNGVVDEGKKQEEVKRKQDENIEEKVKRKQEKNLEEDRKSKY